MLNLNQLRIFYHAAKHLSVTKAARELCVTQPAVTAQVKLFEKSCALKLFKKKGRNIFLTISRIGSRPAEVIKLSGGFGKDFQRARGSHGKCGSSLCSGGCVS